MTKLAVVVLHGLRLLAYTLTLSQSQGQTEIALPPSKPNPTEQWQRSAFCLIVALFFIIILIKPWKLDGPKTSQLSVNCGGGPRSECHAPRWLRHDLRRINKLLAHNSTVYSDLVYIICFYGFKVENQFISRRLSGVCFLAIKWGERRSMLHLLAWCSVNGFGEYIICTMERQFRVTNTARLQFDLI